MPIAEVLPGGPSKNKSGGLSTAAPAATWRRLNAYLRALSVVSNVSFPTNAELHQFVPRPPGLMEEMLLVEKVAV
jgi:hypothetical protein